MDVTGLDGWAHSTPSDIPQEHNKWMAENDRFCIVTATLGELELMVESGIPETQAIKCCTYNGAKILCREKEIGSLQKGISTDLLIIEGNPAENISDTRNVKHVFLRGKQLTVSR